MLRHVMIGLAAATLVGGLLIPDEGLARAGRAGGARVGAVGGARVGGARVAGGRVAYGRYGRYTGYRRGVGWGVGAAAVGAAAAGAYYNNGYYNNSCYRDQYGQLICPNQYQYRY